MSKSTILLPLIGFESKNILSIEGQLLTFKTGLLDLSRKAEGFRRHVSRLWKLYNHNHSDEKVIYANIDNQTFPIALDSKGYFRVEYKLTRDFTDKELNKKLRFYHDKKLKDEIKLPDISKNGIVNVSPDAKFMVISDVDDTILITHATSFLKRIPQTIVKHAFKRKEVKLMSKFYHEMYTQGARFFYVSNSEMNLFWVIKHFIETRKFPKGPIYLRYHKNWKDFLPTNSDQGIGLGKSQHKIDRISYLIDKFDTKQFLLIGDSGQRDPYTYQAIAEKYPDNICGIMIRDVSKGKRDDAMKVVKESLKEIKVPFHVFHDPKEAIRIERRIYQAFFKRQSEQVKTL
ncbi:phosphatase domain-containing protein [Flammeovirga kamogawensis]|uniref:DUF2183 domain-containing protein n=1 Tax=Flammeovirga kamogawensis TaxID=373891 RepID=A0ABX8GXA9_9BACT|nr:phosphatase domain-containing protein [Flammeovirga kamogawensis]MBB6461283.1 phosphatidate phosphatase APP1 [Flammeovirga kamogawensis]QWG07842.1 DUF2183 domain-containing protein [Flammeovirga kamogawensis]TRX69647.1 DUF2183 domain-containing protein [Flammeovirga kamogawensis]